MKKNLLFAILCVLGLFGTLNAQVVTIDGTVGNREVTTSKNVPAFCGQKWAITQQFYTAEEIGKSSGTIESIAFKTADVSAEAGKYPFTRNLEIYMSNSEDYAIVGNSFRAMSASELVFSGEVEFAYNSWVSIDITDFEYTGENVLICVNDVTGSNVSGGITFDAFKHSVTIDGNNANRALYKRSTSSAFNATATVTGATTGAPVPFVQFTFEGGEEPIVLSANKTTFIADGTDAVTFSVTQGGNAVNDATIYVDGVAQAGYTFSTTTAKEYTVYAKKGSLTSETITITAEAPAIIKPEIDLTKYYRIKVNSGTFANQYLHISNTANTVVTSAKANDLTQIFTIEDAGNGNYYLKNVNGLYIKCDAASGAWWSIYGNATSKTPLLFEYTNETAFYIRDYDKITEASPSESNNGKNPNNSYFKVENGTVYCDAPKTNNDVVTWTLEKTELPLFLTADKETITANGTDVVTFTVKQGNDIVNDATIYINETEQTEYTFSTTTAGNYTVYAQKGTLKSETITITADAAPVAPDAPTNVVATANGQNSITVTWDAVAGAKYYIVYKDGSAWSQEYGTSFTFEGLTAGTEYCFAIQAYDANDLESELSETKCATTEAEQGGDDNTGGDGGDTSGDVVTIDGSAGYSNYVPINSGYKYSISQQYYLKDEIGKDNGTITKIAFQTDGTANYPYTRNIEIYIKNTESSSFSNTNTISLEDSYKVFSGNVTFDEGDAWFTITLANPFTYTGNNILVCVNDITGTSKSNLYFKTFAATSRSLYQTNGNTAFSPKTQYEAKAPEKVPFIQLTFGDASTPEVVKPTISVDKNKTRFTADNSDYVTFTVTPEDAEIWYTTGTQNAVQLTTTDKSFKTSNAGTYSFYAKKDGVESDPPITVEAVAENELTLTLSKNSIVANGIEEVTFAVTQIDINGTTQDVTGKSTFKINGAFSFT